MTPNLLRVKVITERSAWIREMLNQLSALPLKSYEEFVADSRNVVAAESYLLVINQETYLLSSIQPEYCRLPIADCRFERR